MSGLDNVFLNAERTGRAHLVRRREQSLEAEKLCHDLGIPPSILRRAASDMSQLDQELLEIAKAIRIARNVLILDEPTAPLTTREIESLFRVIRSAAGLGIGIVLVTHHLAEVFAVSDQVTTLREGTVTLRQAIRLFLSVMTGKSSGGGTTSITFRDIGDTKDRVKVTVDNKGNRTAVNTRDGN